MFILLGGLVHGQCDHDRVVLGGIGEDGGHLEEVTVQFHKVGVLPHLGDPLFLGLGESLGLHQEVVDLLLAFHLGLVLLTGVGDGVDMTFVIPVDHHIGLAARVGDGLDLAAVEMGDIVLGDLGLGPDPGHSSQEKPPGVVTLFMTMPVLGEDVLGGTFLDALGHQLLGSDGVLEGVSPHQVEDGEDLVGFGEVVVVHIACCLISVTKIAVFFEISK